MPGHHEIEHICCCEDEFFFRRTSDPNTYYLGLGTRTDPFLIPFGATGDSDRADTVAWVTSVRADVGADPPSFVDL